MPSSADLLDVNVWLALAVEGHSHHPRAAHYWDAEAAPQAGLCRVTQLALVRLLTNRTIMGRLVLSPMAAWKMQQEFQALPEVRFLDEPSGLEDQLGRFCSTNRMSPNLWTDAYLAAFARCASMRLVTFDRGFSAFPDLDLLVLE